MKELLTVKQREIDNLIIQGATFYELFAKDIFWMTEGGVLQSTGLYPLERCLRLRMPRLDFMLGRCEIRTVENANLIHVQIIAPDEKTKQALYGDESADLLIAESEQYLGKPVEMDFSVDPNILDKEFYQSRAWLRLRYLTLERYGFQCMACKRPKRESGEIHVDHIKPRSKYPELALDPNNLQVLCMECNLGKSNKFEHDHRGGP